MPGAEENNLKNYTIGCCAAILLFSALAGCTTAISPPPVGIEVERDVTLPLTVDKVWYRTEKVRLLGLAYEESGTVTVTENAIEFTHEKGTIKIAKANIQKIVWGKLSPDIINDWVVVHYMDSGRSAVAAFKGALFSGGGTDSKLDSAALQIMRAK